MITTLFIIFVSAFCCVAGVVFGFALYLDKNGRRIEKELREDGYYD